MDNEFSRPIPLERIDRKGIKETFAATPEECLVLAERLQIRSINEVKAEARLTATADKMTYHVKGHMSASVIQACVVSDEDVPQQIDQEFEGWFINRQTVTSFQRAKALKNSDDVPREIEMPSEQEDPEEITNGAIDIGELVTQHLSLALEPFPRALGEGAGDYFENKDKPNAFAILASMKTKE